MISFLIPPAHIELLIAMEAGVAVHHGSSRAKIQQYSLDQAYA